ncbi:MAG: MotA/TolQ/ExbB proton channel family protein [Myxococcales bacterium]|nr:MotA/TolQ/ExbB proton channel family protein [Myxococcales bacterium]
MVLTEFLLGVTLIGAEWVLYLLVLMSLVSFALIIERFVFYRRAEQNRAAMQSALARDGEAGLRVHLERNLTWLASIGSNAPFIGLFGTVLGIIRAFHNLSGDLTGGADVVMGAISEALVATAVGIFVAIPALAAYNGFQRKVEQLHALALGPAPAEGRVD